MDAVEFTKEIRRRRDEEAKTRKEILQLQQRLQKIQDEALALEKAAHILGLKPVSTVNGDESKTSPQDRRPSGSKPVPSVEGSRSNFTWGKPLSDYVEEILQRAGKSLHINHIYTQLLALEPMRERIGQLDGSGPSWESVDAAIRKDPKKRFRLVDTRTYDLTEKN